MRNIKASCIKLYLQAADAEANNDDMKGRVRNQKPMSKMISLGLQCACACACMF